MGSFAEAGRAVARQVLPGNAYALSRAVWHRGTQFGTKIHALRMGYHLLSARAFPKALLHFGAAPGDDLLCTAVARELRKRGIGPIWMLSNYPEIFAGAGDVTRVLPISIDGGAFAKCWSLDYRYLEYARFVGDDDRSESPPRHIIAELCAGAGITGTVALRPYLHMSAEEVASGAWAGGGIAIQSSGLAGKLPMRNKQWYPERFQAVVDTLRDEYDFVQLGSESDPPLNHVIDLRGRTGIRQAAAILHHARIYVGNVGFLMHLARAVECPSIIIYGGREAPWQSGYACNMNVYTPVSCAPCWRWNTCDYDRKCMEAIKAEGVAQGVRQVLARPRGPLPTDTAEI
jgi:Glycosyltransferase family 9 (heptosyltransferase)